MTLTTTADGLFAAGLVIPVALSTLEYMSRPTWHKAATFLALILVLLGYASSLFLSLHFEDHTAYMVAFGSSTFGSACLIVSSVLNLHRLCARLQHVEGQGRKFTVFGVSPSAVVGLIGISQAAAVACFILGCVYLAIVHAGAPISNLADAMARVQSQDRSQAAMFAGYIAQTAGLCIFAMALLGLLRYVPARATPSRSAVEGMAAETSSGCDVQMRGFARTAYFNLVATILSVLVCRSHSTTYPHYPLTYTQIRTSYHLIEFYMTDPEGLEVAATSTLGFYLDLAPMFCACWAVLGQSTALNAADEVADQSLGQSGWPGNEKSSSAC